MSLRRAFSLVLILNSGPAYAGGDDLPSAQDLADAAGQRFPQPVRVGDLIARDVLDQNESRPLLGQVKSVVRKPDGTLAIIMQYGGIFGFFGRPIAVPINAMVLVGQDMALAEYDPDQLKQFPTFKPESAKALPPASVIRVALGKPSH